MPSTGSCSEHHGSASAICSLLPRERRQAPSTCLHELREKVPGNRVQPAACSQARLELQGVERVTDDAVICAFLGERLGP